MKVKGVNSELMRFATSKYLWLIMQTSLSPLTQIWGQLKCLAYATLPLSQPKEFKFHFLIRYQWLIKLRSNMFYYNPM